MSTGNRTAPFRLRARPWQVGLAAAIATLIAALPAAAGGKLSDYSVAQFLETCTQADNDSRWGAVAELECEQYISGFTDALVLSGGVGKDKGICLPELNRPDEVRWAFMRWAHEDYSVRKKMPAADGLLATLKDKMACK